ncbi:MAG: hypothetical protein ACRD3Q_08760 [Terriglobales bacterium]
MKRRALVADIWPEARDDVDDIRIAREHPESSTRYLDEFDLLVDRLLQFPNLGAVWPTTRPDVLAAVRRLVLRHFPVSIFSRPDEGHP